ncbi:MAG: hypothetical protein PVI23_16280 [Maricaulaceae bacterium]|jgi:hypothetical protein
MRALLALATAAVGACALIEPLEPVNELPFARTRDGRILIDVVINDIGPYPFVVDTAAGATIVDQSLAAELELVSQGFELTILGLESAVALPAFAPARLGLGTDTVELDWLLVHDLDQPGARGVLGLDALSRYAVMIDGRRQVLGLSHGRYAPRRAVDNATEIKIAPNAFGLPIVEYDINRARGAALIDTGIGGLIVDPDFADLARVARSRTDEELSDLTNTDLPVRRIGRGTVSMAGAEWSRIEMALARPLVFEHLAENEISALLGADLFASVTLVLDFPAQRIFVVERRSSFSQARTTRVFQQTTFER